jgi:hypothetical protein
VDFIENDLSNSYSVAVGTCLLSHCLAIRPEWSSQRNAREMAFGSKYTSSKRNYFVCSPTQSYIKSTTLCLAVRPPPHFVKEETPFPNTKWRLRKLYFVLVLAIWENITRKIKKSSAKIATVL